MKKIEYNLLKVVQPILNGNVLVSDRGTFGITLTYEVNYYKVWIISQKFNLKIPNIIPYKTEIKTYLRPLKNFWSDGRERLPKNYWGMKTHPLCGVVFWWEIRSDYGCNKIPKLKEQVKSHDLIKRLRSATLQDEIQLKKLNFNPKKFHFYQQSKTNQNER